MLQFAAATGSESCRRELVKSGDLGTRFLSAKARTLLRRGGPVQTSSLESILKYRGLTYKGQGWHLIRSIGSRQFYIFNCEKSGGFKHNFISYDLRWRIPIHRGGSRPLSWENIHLMLPSYTLCVWKQLGTHAGSIVEVTVPDWTDIHPNQS